MVKPIALPECAARLRCRHTLQSVALQALGTGTVFDPDL